MAFTALTTRQKQIVETGTGLFAKRQNLMSFWQEVAEHFYPERATFTKASVLGEDFGSHLMESYPVTVRQELGNAFATTLRPRGAEWFKPVPERESIRELDDVKAFFQRIGKGLTRALYDHRSNFVRATHEADHDYVTFGNAVLSGEERKSRDGLFFSAWHLRDCAWLENAERVVDHMHRNFELTGHAALAKWRDKLHPETARAAEKSPSDNIKFRHVVLPAEEYGDKDIAKAGDKRPFISMIVEVERHGLIEAKAIAYFPYVVARWKLLSDSQYATSPCVTAGLSDARLLQRQALTILEAGEKAVDPPLIATREAVVGGVNIAAGGITWIDGEYDERMGNALRPLDMGSNTGLGLEMKKDTREMLSAAFFLNKLTLPDTREMTAFETDQRVKEYVRAVAPLFEPIEAGYNGPLLTLALDILMDVKAFGDMDIPDAARGQDITFTFTNPLQDTTEAKKASRLVEGMNLISAAVQADQQALRVARIPVALRDALEALGWDVMWLNTEEIADDADKVSDVKHVANDVAQLGGAAANVLSDAGNASRMIAELNSLGGA